MSSYNLSPVYQTPQFSNAGQLLVGGKIYWYLGGTTTLVTVYQDNQGSAAHTQPIILDSRGEPPAPIWLLGGQTYKAVLQDSSGNQLQVIDNITGVGDVTFASSSVTQLTINSTGNGAKIYQGASGDLEFSTNQNSGTPSTWKLTNLLTFPDGTSMATGQYTGFRNRLINGGCQVGQRGSIGFSATSNLYGWVDRWLISISGTTVSALGYQASGQPTATGYVLQVGNVTTTGTTTVAVSQRIESLNCAGLNSSTVTFSCQVKQVTGSAQTLTLVLQKANAADNFNGGTTVINSTTQSIPNNAYTTVSWTVTLGSTDASNGISISLAFNSIGAQSNAQFYYGDLQLEKGSIATPFEVRPYGTELALCQRYYETGAARIESYISASGNGLNYQYTFKATKRATPTLEYAMALATNVSTYDARLPTTDSFLWYCASTAAGQCIWAGTWTATAEL